MNHGNSRHQETGGCALLLSGQHLGVGEPCGVVDGHVHSVVSDASKAALLPIVFVAMAHLGEWASFLMLL